MKKLNQNMELALDRFLTEVCQNAKLKKKLENSDWYDLSIGFFLACELSFNQAEKLAIHVRYELKYTTRANL